MNVLIISDTHGRRSAIDEVLAKVGAVDMVIHLGDIEGDGDYLISKCNCPVHIVAGNNDFGGKYQREKIIDIAGKQVWITHGHKHHVSYDLKLIASETLTYELDMVMFGHTHVPTVSYINGVTLVNPGSLAYPRGSVKKPSFIMLDVDSEKNFHFSIDYLY